VVCAKPESLASAFVAWFEFIYDAAEILLPAHRVDHPTNFNTIA
jgi:hypothetical protein